MQWNLVTTSNLPEPGESVLGLWTDGVWKKVAYAASTGWYTSHGLLDSPPVWWALVDSRVPKASEVGEVGPVCEEGPPGPDASVLEHVRKFLEQLIEVRDLYVADLELRLPAEYCGKYECYDDWAADKAAELLKMLSLVPIPANPIRDAARPGVASVAPPLALDVSLEQARALHRVWRALNDGDCPNCHKFHAATEIVRSSDAITCPSCWFHVKKTEIAAIEQMFAPAMDAAVAIFNKWRDEIHNKQE